MTELRPPPEPKPKPSHGDQHAFLLLPSGHPLQLAHVSRAPRSWARENQSQADVSNDRLCLGQMQAAICSPSTQSHLTTASPHHCRCPTHLFPPRHGEGHCLQRMGKVYTQTSHPYLFSHQEPFSGKSDKYNQHLPNPRGCLHFQGTQNPAGLVGVRAPRSVGLPRQTATTRSFFPCMVVTHADFPAQLSIKFELSTI